MKIIIITRPDFFPQEALLINEILKFDSFYVHIRKPESDQQQVQSLIESIGPECRNRIVLHDHHQLAVKYSLGGIHLNGRNPVPLPGFSGTVSRSCHSFAELMSDTYHCDYSFLSPIFDSISKNGYSSAFTGESLCSARQSGIITDRVYALGGVTMDRLPILSEYGFGGAALLGEPWNMVSPDTDVRQSCSARFSEYLASLAGYSTGL